MNKELCQQALASNDTSSSCNSKVEDFKSWPQDPQGVCATYY